MKGHYVARLVDLLVEMGVQRAYLLMRCELDEAELTSDTLIDLRRVSRIFGFAAHFSSDPAIGLIAGQRLNINTHGPLGYAAMACENLAQALHLLVKYYRVQAPRANIRLHLRHRGFELVCEPSFEIAKMPWLTAEFLISSIFTSIDFLLGGRVSGVEVCFRYAQPVHVKRCIESFRVPCHFESSFNGLLISREVALLPLVSADAIAAKLFQRRCENLKREIESSLLSERIRGLQVRRAGEFLSQTEIANKVGLSVSTLHRRLLEEGLSYKDLLVEIKKEIAIEQLQAQALTLEQIAHLLGFSDASNFRRAFISWTGMKPSDFR